MSSTIFNQNRIEKIREFLFQIYSDEEASKRAIGVTLDIVSVLPEVIKIYKSCYHRGLSYEAIKAEIKSQYHGMGEWLYGIAEEICRDEL